MSKGLKVGDKFEDNGLLYEITDIHELGYYVSTLVGKASVGAKAEVKEEEATTETLEDMAYADLKKLAKEKGVSAKGSKEEVLERLRGV